MENLRGAKIGWLLGWFGSFLWVAIVSVVFLFQGKRMEGVSGLMLFCVAGAILLAFVPWRYPFTPFWKLMLPLYIPLFISVPWAVWGFGGTDEPDFQGWTLLPFLSLLSPLLTVGNRKWAVHNAQNPEIR